MSNPSRGMIFPVVLIVLGVLFLAHNLGYIGFAQLREVVGTWWPLILIAVGVSALVTRGK
jgi:hypothetical protein